MNTDKLIAAMRRLPKVELHVHLEGATDAETVWEMAERNGVVLAADSIDDWKLHYKFKNFTHFIDVYAAAAATMRTPDDWVFMVKRFLRNQAAQNIVYSEVFISASHQVGKLPPDELIDAIAQGAAEGEKLYNTQIRFTIDISRHMPETQQAVLECAILGKKTGYIIGLGLGGIEEGFPPSVFKETYKEARHQGLHVVAHAGETTGPETIIDSIEMLHVERIGHGIRCLDDPQLVERLRETQLPLEVCPTSNYCLGVVEEDQPHPLRRMVDMGLFCTVNSDDPPMFSTSLLDEYALLFRQGFNLAELARLNLNAVEASFLPRESKDELRQRIELSQIP